VPPLLLIAASMLVLTAAAKAVGTMAVAFVGVEGSPPMRFVVASRELTLAVEPPGN
jgi:hypothetical protein